MAKLFVSYSRKDSVAARKLVEGFRSMDQEVWVDWEDIPLAADWLNQIFTGIEEADVFVFLISPDSISSEVCKVEISRAVSNHKRIIPIVLRDVNPKDTIEEIRKLNWTFIRETDNFEEGLAKVKTAIELDLDWLEEHRRLQVRALEWHRKKDTSLLLRGRDLRNAEHMLKTYTSRDPIPTDLQRKYIEFSQRTERTRNIVLVVTGITLIIMIVLTFIAVNNSNEAQRMTVTAQANEFRASTNADLFKQQRVTAEANKVLADNNAATARAEKSIAEQERQKAQAQRSAARAQIYQSRPGELYTSILFAIDSMQKYRTDEAEEVLRKNISMLPLPVAPQISKQRNINDLAYNLKGDTFATASADGTTCAWNTISGEELFCTPAGQPVNAVAFSPDGSLIITGDQSGIVQILDAGHQGNVLHRYQRVKPKAGQGNVKVADVKDGLGGNEPLSAETPVRVVGFSPDGKQVAVAYEDKQIPVFNWDTGNITASLATGTRPNVFGFTRNGSQLVAGSEGGSITFWNLRAKGDSITPSDHKGGAVAIAFSRDNSKVATAGNDNRVVIISPKERKQLLQILTQSTVRDLAFSPDGSWLFTGADDHRARVWDVENGKELLSMSHDGAVSKVAVSPNGQWLATTSEDRTTRIWDRTTGSQIFQIPLRDSGAAVAFSSDGRYLVSADKSGAINIWDLSLLGVRQQWLPFRRAASNVQYSPSGEWIAYSSEDLVWLIKLNPETGEISQQSPLDLKSSVQHLVFSLDSKFIGLSMEGNEIAIYNVENRSLRTAKVPIGIQSIAFSPNNQQFIASDGKGNVQVWDLSGDLLTPNTNQEYSNVMALAGSSKFLALGLDKRINIVDGEGDGGLLPVDAPGENTLLALSEDGTWLASANTSGQIRIWKYENGTYIDASPPSDEKDASPLNKGQAASLAFNPDGTLLGLGTAQYAILIDTASGKEIARIPHRDIVNGLSFSKDGKHLATTSSTFLQLWNLDKLEKIKGDEALIQTACSRLARKINETQLKSLFADAGPSCKDLLESK